MIRSVKESDILLITKKITHSKIIHKELNTMLVNHRWMMSHPVCPFCHTTKEGWKHVSTCKPQVRVEMRDECISDFELKLEQHHTYLPLFELLVDFVTQQNFDQYEPNVVNPRYCILFQCAFATQNQIGWENFSHGIIAHDWKCLQYQHFLESQTIDIHTVDKWAWMLI